MKPFSVTIDATRFEQIDRLATAAGSRLGEGPLMMSASDLIGWLVREARAAGSIDASGRPVADDPPKADAS